MPSRLSIATIFSYIFDYAVVVALIILFGKLESWTGHHQRFSLNDINLQQPYAENSTISSLLLFILGVVVPAAIILIWLAVVEGRFNNRSLGHRALPLDWKMRLWNLNAAWLGLGLSIALAITITDIFKVTVGKPRPDLIARCIPQIGAGNDSIAAMVGIEVCTQTDRRILQDGFRSFPSGHASLSAAGLVYLSLFLSARLALFDQRGEVWKTFIVFAPLLTAALVAITRVMDGRHHGFDVLFGSLLGYISAYVAYRQYFPSIESGGLAYSPREFGHSAEATQYADVNETRAKTEHEEPRAIGELGNHSVDLERGRASMEGLARDMFSEDRHR